jgi:hypothetical protein
LENGSELLDQPNESRMFMEEPMSLSYFEINENMRETTLIPEKSKNVLYRNKIQKHVYKSIIIGACGNLMVEALGYKPEGRGFGTR